MKPPKLHIRKTEVRSNFIKVIAEFEGQTYEGILLRMTDEKRA